MPPRSQTRTVVSGLWPRGWKFCWTVQSRCIKLERCDTTKQIQKTWILKSSWLPYHHLKVIVWAKDQYHSHLPLGHDVCIAYCGGSLHFVGMTSNLQNRVSGEFSSNTIKRSSRKVYETCHGDIFFKSCLDCQPFDWFSMIISIKQIQLQILSCSAVTFLPVFALQTFWIAGRCTKMLTGPRVSLNISSGATGALANSRVTWLHGVFIELCFPWFILYRQHSS